MYLHYFKLYSNKSIFFEVLTYFTEYYILPYII